jgi:hypothetical protein
MRTPVVNLGRAILWAVVLWYHAGITFLLPMSWLLAVFPIRYEHSKLLVGNLAHFAFSLALLGVGAHYCLVLHIITIGRKRANWSSGKQLVVTFCLFVPVFGAFYYAKSADMLASLGKASRPMETRKSGWRRAEHVIAILLAGIAVLWAVVFFAFPELPISLHNYLAGWKPPPEDKPLHEAQSSQRGVVAGRTDENQSVDPNLNWMSRRYLEQLDTNGMQYPAPCNDTGSVSPIMQRDE